MSGSNDAECRELAGNMLLTAGGGCIVLVAVRFWELYERGEFGRGGNSVRCERDSRAGNNRKLFGSVCGRRRGV